MEQINKLVLEFDKKNFKNNIVIAPIFSTLILFLLFKVFSVNLIGASFIKYAGVVTSQILLSLLLCFFVFLMVYSIIFVSYKNPAAVLDQNGIWLKHYGFIPWDAIDQFTLYRMFGSSDKELETVGIMLKNPKAISKQANLRGKLGIIGGRIFGNYHIILSNITAKNEDVVNFAKRYLK